MAVSSAAVHFIVGISRQSVKMRSIATTENHGIEFA